MISQQDLYWLVGLALVIVIGVYGFWGKSQSQVKEHKG
jgi:hypothetical protein